MAVLVLVVYTETSHLDLLVYFVFYPKITWSDRFASLTQLLGTKVKTTVKLPIFMIKHRKEEKYTDFYVLLQVHE